MTLLGHNQTVLKSLIVVVVVVVIVAAAAAVTVAVAVVVAEVDFNLYFHPILTKQTVYWGLFYSRVCFEL